MVDTVLERKLNIDKSSWQPVKLGDLAKEVSNRVDNPSESGMDRFVGLQHFVSGDLKIKNWGSTKNLGSSMKAFKKGNILFARRNAYLRRASMVDFDGVCSGDAFVLVENHDKIVPGFLAFIVNSDRLWDFANSNAAGTMSKRVKWRDLAEYELLLPPKDQQERLAELLWAGDAVVETLISQEAILASVKKSCLKESFNKTDCRKVKFSDISENLDNRRIPIKKSVRKKGKVPYFGASGIVDYVKGYIFDEPILLISEDGENLKSRVLPIAYEFDEKCWVNNHAHVVKITAESRYLVKEYFNFHDLKGFITGGTRPKITKGMLSDMPIYLPLRALRRTIESCITEHEWCLLERDGAK
ncbi:MAG: restriction endonuclease subunit S [Bacteroidota bacterium]